MGLGMGLGLGQGSWKSDNGIPVNHVRADDSNATLRFGRAIVLNAPKQLQRTLQDEDGLLRNFAVLS